MKNDLFSIGPFTIHGYGLMIALGILACIALGMYRARKRNMSDEAVLDIAIFGVLFGFLGAKALYVIVEFPDFLKDPMSVLGSEGFVVYGGIITGVLAAMIYCRIKHLKFLEYFWLPLLLWPRDSDGLAVSWPDAVTEEKPMHSGVLLFQREALPQQALN